MVMYQNGHYVVVANPEGDAYYVSHRDSGVVEFSDKALPKCIIAANQYSQALSDLTKEVSNATNVIALRPDHS